MSVELLGNMGADCVKTEPFASKRVNTPPAEESTEPKVVEIPLPYLFVTTSNGASAAFGFTMGVSIGSESPLVACTKRTRKADGPRVEKTKGLGTGPGGGGDGGGGLGGVGEGAGEDLKKHQGTPGR